MCGYDGEWQGIVFRVGHRAAVDGKVLELAIPFSRGWPGVPHAGNLEKVG